MLPVGSLQRWEEHVRAVQRVAACSPWLLARSTGGSCELSCCPNLTVRVFCKDVLVPTLTTLFALATASLRESLPLEWGPRRIREGGVGLKGGLNEGGGASLSPPLSSLPYAPPLTLGSPGGSTGGEGVSGGGGRRRGLRGLQGGSKGGGFKGRGGASKEEGERVGFKGRFQRGASKGGGGF